VLGSLKAAKRVKRMKCSRTTLIKYRKRALKFASITIKFGRMQVRGLIVIFLRNSTAFVEGFQSENIPLIVQLAFVTLFLTLLFFSHLLRRISRDLKYLLKVS